jgi:hypothetical protein
MVFNKIYRIKKEITLLFFITLLNACGKIAPQVDADLKPYIQKFEQEIDHPASYISAKFANLESPVLGRCTFSYPPLIEIDPETWQNLSEYGREQLMYHELGHCALGLKHDDTTTMMGEMELPASIMNTYFFGESWFYMNNNEKYKEALKNNTTVKF